MGNDNGDNSDLTRLTVMTVITIGDLITGASDDSGDLVGDVKYISLGEVAVTGGSCTVTSLLIFIMKKMVTFKVNC